MELSNAIRWIRSRQINDRHAEWIFLEILFMANGEGSCGCRLKELAQEVGLSVREVREKLRLLRSLKMISTYACKDGYAFFLSRDFTAE
jgi:hypothetical protein